VIEKRPTGLTYLRRAGIANLHVALQPIWDVSTSPRRLHAAECLIRGPKGSALENPSELFQLVRQTRSEVRFDQACLELTLEAVSALPGEFPIAVNVYAATLCKDPDFARFLDSLAWGKAVKPARLTVDIAEYGRFAQDPALSTAVRALKSLGMSVALDDSGLGDDADFPVLLELKPGYLKVARELVAGLATDDSNRSILEGFVSLGQGLGFQVIVEGVETEWELSMVTLAGVHLAQGFLLGEPMDPDEFRRRVIHADRSSFGGPVRL
jgi:EAL domain-containing protein (putative c-di-GMP-specific phosphodiesterase class I)